MFITEYKLIIMKRLYIALSALMAFSAVNAQRNNSVIKDIAEKKYAACPFAGIVPMADGEIKEKSRYDVSMCRLLPFKIWETIF